MGARTAGLAPETSPAPRTAGETRDQIVLAAERVIQQRGLSGATTRAIALEAGCAEGSLYRHFPDKHALLVEVVKRRFPRFVEVLHALPDRAGTATVQANLREVAVAALEFYRAIVPVVAGAMAEHALLAEHRRYFEEQQRGPMHSYRVVADYIRREQKIGRVSRAVSADHAARLLLGTCWGQACMIEVFGPAASMGADHEFGTRIVQTLIEGIGPRELVEPAEEPADQRRPRRSRPSASAKASSGSMMSPRTT